MGVLHILPQISIFCALSQIINTFLKNNTCIYTVNCSKEFKNGIEILTGKADFKLIVIIMIIQEFKKHLFQRLQSVGTRNPQTILAYTKIKNSQNIVWINNSRTAWPT